MIYYNTKINIRRIIIWVYFQVYSQESRLQIEDIIKDHIRVVAIIAKAINIHLKEVDLKSTCLNSQGHFLEVLLGANI